ncbi:MAG TPA: hypothetical protein VKB03_10795 [Conexibacter sp.]|nr:hypothetical protein [Conexibacter sp.]
MSTTADEAATAFARWLAPYIATELRIAPPRKALDDSYDANTCEEYVRELGQGVLNRASNLFALLEAQGRVGSLELARAIGTTTPKNIPANLTNSLKQRARRLRLDRLPWDEGEHDGRTVWVDRDGIAARMVAAVQEEQRRRQSPTG